MKIYVKKNNVWTNLEDITDNVFFNALDAYNGSQKTSLFKAVLDENENNMKSFSLRFLHNFNNFIYSFLPEHGMLDVVCKEGDPRLSNKIKFNLKIDVNESNILSGNSIIPDENGVFNLGDLNINTELLFSITCISEPRIISNFGEKIEVTSIDLSFLYQDNGL